MSARQDITTMTKPNQNNDCRSKLWKDLNLGSTQLSLGFSPNTNNPIIVEHIDFFFSTCVGLGYVTFSEILGPFVLWNFLREFLTATLVVFITQGISWPAQPRSP